MILIGRTYSRISDLGISRRGKKFMARISRRMQMLLFHVSRFPSLYLRRTAFQTATLTIGQTFPAKTFRYGNQFRRVAPTDSSSVNRHRSTNTSVLPISLSFFCPPSVYLVPFEPTLFNVEFHFTDFAVFLSAIYHFQ